MCNELKPKTDKIPVMKRDKNGLAYVDKKLQTAIKKYGVSIEDEVTTNERIPATLLQAQAMRFSSVRALTKGKRKK